MTAQREVAQIVEGLRAGANDYLTKPYAAEELRARTGALARSKALRERAEEAEAFLRTLLASLPDAVLLVNPAGQVSFANDQALSILALRGRRIMGEPIEVVVPGLRLDTANESGVLPDVHIGPDVFEPLVRPPPRRDRHVADRLAAEGHREAPPSWVGSTSTRWWRTTSARR